MIRNENIAYHIKKHVITDALETSSVDLLKLDSQSNDIVRCIPLSLEYLHSGEAPTQVTRPDHFNVRLRFAEKFINVSSYDASPVRVVVIGGVEQLNPLNNYAAGVHTIFRNTDDEPVQETCDESEQKRESKVPNIPLMIRCQNCDTNFPTKYQFQRHQCEFNAEKVVLKANVDTRDVGKGLRMKFDCKTCGKQFVSKNNLDRHLTSHDEDNVNICEYCNKQFVSENRLRIHKENHCKKTGDISKFYRSDVTVWRCTKCFQVFSSESFASVHADACEDVVTDPIAIKNANEDVIPESFDSRGSNVNLMQNYEESEPVDISEHIEKIRTELLLQCEFCNQTYANKKTLVWHQDSHTTETNYNCVICNEKFESYTVAAKHWLTECTREANLFFLPKLIYCKSCNRTFKSHEILYLHKIKKKHYTPKRHLAANKSSNSVDNSIVKFEIEDTDYSNVAKKIKIEDDDAMEYNINGKAAIMELIDNVLGTSKSNNNSENTKEDKFTGQSSSSITTVKSEVVSELNLTTSDDVPEEKKKRGRKRKAVTQNTKAKKFMTEVESGFKYQCERCVLLFNTVMDLEIHRNKDHPANYKCEECDQVVHSSKALMIHSRAHQSLKPYVCEICKRCYSQTSHLWQHMRFHQGIKPFACPHEGCEARYTIRPDLKDHIRKVHTRERPFKCNVCDKCFLTGSVYYQHRLIHTNDRRYACDICDKRFFRADALNNHRRIHTDERPYPCSVCGRNFRQKGDRNKHVRTQHPDAQP